MSACRMRLWQNVVVGSSSFGGMSDCQVAFLLCLLAPNQSFDTCAMFGGAYQSSLSAGLEKLVIKQKRLHLITRSQPTEVQCSIFEAIVWDRA